MSSPALPSRQRPVQEREQLDLFRALPGDMAPRDSQDLMAYPFFSLAKSRRTAPIDFRAGNVTIRVEGTQEHGIATIWDADVLIWAASQIVEAKDAGLRPSRLMQATPSTERAWMASVSWDYPRDRMLALQRQAQAAQATAPVDTGLSLERIRFRYAISGSNPPWKPLRAFDDGEKVYIQFPPGIAQGELPPLFVIGAQGDGQLVNYRFRSPYYIVDRLFGAAELRLGGDGGDVVRIERTDGTRRN